MNYPQNGYGQPQQGYAQPPQQGYGPPQNGYAAPPQQGYGQPQQGPAPALPRGSLEEFLNQPAMSGAGINSAVFPSPGSRVIVRVARDLTDADVAARTEMNDPNKARTFRDGRVMMRLIVPVLVQHFAVPDGRGALSVQGQMYEELKRAMSEAGNTAGIPEGGSLIDITRQNDKPSARQGHNPQHIFAITYTRPEGAANGNAPGQAQAQAPAPQVPQDIQAMVPQPPQQGPPQGQYAQQGPPQGQFMPPEQFQNAQQGPPQPQYAQQGPPQPQYAQQGPPQGQQWPAPGAPLSTPPQPAPPGENPYNNPALPPNQPQQYAQQGPPQPAPGQQMQLPYGQAPVQQQGQPQYGMQGPGAQVAAATQAGYNAAQAVQQGPPQQQQQYAQQGPPVPAAPVPAAPAALDPSQQAILATLINQGQQQPQQ